MNNDQITNRHTCDKAPHGWQCLRDIGHEGPCAAAPLTGSGACPDIDRCLADGCQCKCGPDEKSVRSEWGPVAAVIVLLIPLVIWLWNLKP